MKKAIVTGGAGFIGQYLCKHLQLSGWEVVALDLKPLPPGFKQLGVAYQPADIRYTGWWRHLSGDVLYHLAAAPWGMVDPDPLFLEVNYTGTVIALNAAHEMGSRFILASSAQVYGPPVVSPQTEEHPLLAVNHYSKSKILAERSVAEYQEMGLGKAIAARFANVYGPGQYRGAVIPDLIAKLHGERNVLTLQGTGQETRDFIYAEDIVGALRLLGETEELEEGTYNIGSGTSTTIETLAKSLMEIIGRKIPIEYTGVLSLRDAKQESPRALDCSRLRGELGWTPQWSLNRGLWKTVEACGREKQ